MFVKLTEIDAAIHYDIGTVAAVGGIAGGFIGALAGGFSAYVENQQTKRQIQDAIDETAEQIADAEEKAKFQQQQAEERKELAIEDIDEQREEAVLNTYSQQRTMELQGAREVMTTATEGQRAGGQLSAGLAGSGVRKSGSAQAVTQNVRSLYDVRLDEIESGIEERQSAFDLTRGNIESAAERQSSAIEEQFNQTVDMLNFETTQLTDAFEREAARYQGELDWVNTWGWANIVTSALGSGIEFGHAGYDVGGWFDKPAGSA